MSLPTEYGIVVPDVGAGALRVRVCSWLAELGESIREGDRIVELSLPGMTFDVHSPADGQLIGIDKTLGTEVHPGDILGRLQVIHSE